MSKYFGFDYREIEKLLDQENVYGDFYKEIHDKIEGEIKRRAEMFVREANTAIRERDELQEQLEELQDDLRVYKYEDKKRERELIKKEREKIIRNLIGEFLPGDKVWAVERRWEDEKCPQCSDGIAKINIEGGETEETTCAKCGGKGKKRRWRRFSKEIEIEAISVNFSRRCCSDDGGLRGVITTYVGTGMGEYPSKVFRTKEECDAYINERYK